jgi:hypothetical protein
LIYVHVGRRYPAVNIVILTNASFNYALGMGALAEPPQDSSADGVILIKDMAEWQKHWDQTAPYNKLVPNLYLYIHIATVVATPLLSF